MYKCTYSLKIQVSDCQQYYGIHVARKRTVELVRSSKTLAKYGQNWYCYLQQKQHMKNVASDRESRLIAATFFNISY